MGKITRLWLKAALAIGTPGSDTFKLAQVNQYGRLHFAQKDANVTVDLAAQPMKWQLKMFNDNPTTANGNLENDPAEMEDVFLVLGYDAEVP
jgi:hypothetical protein